MKYNFSELHYTTSNITKKSIELLIIISILYIKNKNIIKL